MPRRRRGSPLSPATSPKWSRPLGPALRRQTAVAATGRRVAYHSACSMQHGQRIHAGPKALLTRGRVRDARRARRASLLRLGRHLQSAAAGDRGQAARAQARQHRQTRPDLVATGNIGCITQLAAGCAAPVVHTVELLDWATGGPMPRALDGR